MPRRIYSRAPRSVFFFLTIATTLTGVPASAAQDECDVKFIASMVKAIGILRRIENSINYLALGQTNAIIAIETGIPTHPTNETDNSFFGPRMVLRKTTDKTESFLADLDKSMRRLPVFSEIEQAYTLIDQNSDKIVSAGYQVLEQLEADDVPGATRTYASTTVPALFVARRDAYTAMSNFERTIEKAGLHCM